MNAVYSHVAVMITQWENHQYVEHFTESVISKRIPFELFDCFLSLFYLMLWEQNVPRLRHELYGLFVSDTLRRLLMESVLPFVQYRLSKRVTHRDKQQLKSDLDLFDDYIEMLVQFGYVLLFARVFPFAACLACIANICEVRSDLFKVLFIHRRPRQQRGRSIGIWFFFFCLVAGAAPITNVVLHYVTVW